MNFTHKLVSPGACIQTRIGARGGVGMSPTRLALSHRVATAVLGHYSYSGSLAAPVQVQVPTAMLLDVNVSKSLTSLHIF